MCVVTNKKYFCTSTCWHVSTAKQNIGIYHNITIGRYNQIPSPFVTFSSSLTGRSTFQSSLRLQTYRTKVSGLDNLLKSILHYRWNFEIIFIRISQTTKNGYEFRFRKREKKLKCMQNYFCGEDSVSSCRTYTNQLLPLENYCYSF